MNDKIFNLPDTFEEGQARLDEISEKLNAYNVACLAETALPYTDEEVQALQDEYELLEDYLSQRHFVKEKKQKVVVEKIDDEKEESSKFARFLNQVNPIIWLYILIALVFSNYYFFKIIGNEILTTTLIDWEWVVGISKTELWLYVFGEMIFFPLCLILLTVVLFLIFRKGMNHQVMRYFLMAQALIAFVSLIFVYIFCAKDFYEVLEEYRIYYELFGAEA